MALIIDLKPGEKIIVGKALITNDSHRARLHIEGDAPILREKDILLQDEAQSPCQLVYMTVQLMYLSDKPHELHQLYFNQVKDVQNAAPSTALFFMRINDNILDGNYYKALKEAKNLIEHEKEILKNV
jgi:flagellar protein FlbT